MRFIKHIIGAVLTTALIGVPLTLTQIVYADISDISVYVNGIKTEFDEPPASENDRTLVPMRGILRLSAPKSIGMKSPKQPVLF